MHKSSSAFSIRRVTRWVTSVAIAMAVTVGVADPEAGAQNALPQLPALPALPGFDPAQALPPAPAVPNSSDVLGNVPVPQLPAVPGITDNPAFPDPLGSIDNGQAAPQGDVMLTNVPARISMAVIMPGRVIQTPNANEARPGLSIVKLYLADYALRKGDGSDRDTYLAKRMIRFSDDNAAKFIDRKYPQAINSVAREFGLGNTWRGSHWGLSYTSAMDTARYLNKVRLSRPNSLILDWMRQASPVAADGTQQNWGTSTLRGVTGTKWGWSDYGEPTVASASISPTYTAAAFTFGGPGTQNVDVRSANAYIH